MGADHPVSNPDLTEQIDALRQKMAAQIPGDTLTLMQQAVADLAASGIADRALQAGDLMPAFELPAVRVDGPLQSESAQSESAQSESTQSESAQTESTQSESAQTNSHQPDSVRLVDLLAQGPAVISFYRGGWCPYCNLELQALQRELPEIERVGGRVVAIAPELPEHALETGKAGALSFPLLHDRDNQLAAALGLVFTLPESLRPIYEGFGIDLEASQGNQNFELPMPATYIVRQDRTIAYAWVEVDYTKRLDPTTIVEMLEQK